MQTPVHTDRWKRDFLASMVVFLVALPLCLGIAIASGAPPVLGLITGVIGGIVVGFLSGCPLQVSGPAAGLVSIVYEIVVRYQLRGLGVIVLLAGLMQLLAGVMKLGQWFRAISPSVIHGMLSGIGILIVASQFHVLLDVPPQSTGLANIATIPDTLVKGLFPVDNSSHHLAAMLGGVSLLLMIAWNVLPKRLRILPGTLASVTVATIGAAVLRLPVQYVRIPDGLAQALTLPDANSLSLLGNPDIWIMAGMLALVASAETMLSATAIDKIALQSLRTASVKTDYDRELFAQGVGNTLCGFLGSVPLTGVMVRSSANLDAGAETRWSAILHGVWILALVSLFPHILEKIPTASLAAILVYSGYKLIQPTIIGHLWRISKGEAFVYAVTLIMVVATNLLEGVIIGSILALVKLLITFSSLEGRTSERSGNEADLFLKGSATFLSLPRLVQILDRQPPGKNMVVHVDRLSHIDHACIELLQDWEKRYHQAGGEVSIVWRLP